MFDDIRRVGEKIDDLTGLNIFPFNYPFGYTENFLQHMEKWEFAFPNPFLWLVHMEPSAGNTTHPIPQYINTASMAIVEPNNNMQGGFGSISEKNDISRATTSNEWDIDQGKTEITQKTFMNTGDKNGCLLADGVALPGEVYNVMDVPITNNMGFIPGKAGGNRSALAPLIIQWRETNRSFVDLVVRPWLILASHEGLVARKDSKRNIKCNITIVQLAKTYQYTPLVERKVWRYYNCVPTSIDQMALNYSDNKNYDTYTTQWHYTHYTIESLPNTDMNAEMNKSGFRQFVKDMAVKLLSKSRGFRKLQGKLAKVEQFVDKANKIKKKVFKVLDMMGGKGVPGGKRTGPTPTDRGRASTGDFISDNDNDGFSNAGSLDLPRSPDNIA